MFQLGSGRIFANPLGGNQAANPTPQFFGTCQDFSLEIDQKLEELRGASQFPDDVGPTDRKVSAKIGFGKIEPHHYDAAEVEFMQQVARQVAVAVDNTLNFQSAQAYQQELARERDRLRVLLDVNNALVSTLDLQQLFRAISSSLR